MKYKLESTPRFDKEFKKLDNSVKLVVLKYLKKLESSDNPKSYGKELTGNFVGLFRFRVNNYRIITKFEDKKLIIYALGIGHRSTIYKRFRV